MRLPVSLLALGVVLAGCKSSVDSANVDPVTVSSIPTGAAVRINGEAVGRTPTTIKLDRTKNYELQVGKGGFITETSELKPRLITTSEGIEFGFPASVKVNLSKVPAAGEAGVPPADNPEFKKLAKQALGEEAAAKQELQTDIAATKEAAAKIQAALTVREAAAQARLVEISKNLAAAKAAKNQDAAAKARLREAELALAQAEAEAEEARAKAEKSLKSVGDRQAALAGVEAKVVTARAKVAQTAAPAQVSDDRLVRLEQTYAAEMKALKDSQANSNAAIKALNSRADELNRRANLSVTEAKSGTAKAEVAVAQAKAEAAKNAAAAQAIAQANEEVKLLQAKLAETNKAADKAVADERLSAEAKLADATAKVNEANMAAAEAKARAAALKYSEFSSRYALLESKRRAKAVTEEEFKAALSELRKELEL